MDFYQYVSKKLPEFESVFSVKEMEEVKKLFDHYALWCSVKDTNMRILAQSNASTRALEEEKIESKEVVLKQMLDDKIDSIIAEHFNRVARRFHTK